jgi:predicted alpha/beta hydrolase family esterase
MPSTPTASTTFRAPPLTLLATEPLRALFDFCAARLAAQAHPVGDGHPVIVFPGLGGAPFTTSQLRKHLSASGFDARCWGRGVNTGPEGALEQWLAALVEDVQRTRDEAGRTVSLVGWSLGGVYAREIAKLAPDSVRQVVTLGTPFAAMGGGSTHAETIYRLLGGDTSRLTPELQARLRETPPVPTTAVFSKSDGVVSWRGCIEKRTPWSESVEVSASHLGMVTHPDVLRIVANRLSQPEGRWRPLRRRERTGRR